jgi:hypothetical protein
MNNEETEFVWIIGYEGLYDIDKEGVVRRHYCSIKKGARQKPIGFTIHKTGYKVVSLCKNDVKKSYLLHRLLAIAFIEKIEGKEFVNHKNGIKTDNSLNNLEWCTKKENTIHAFATGLNKASTGVRCGSSKLTEFQVLEIFKSTGITCKKLSIMYNISITNIKDIRRGKIWSHLTGKLLTPKKTKH